ncbi:hypothetical protein GCM10009557_22820 [Virgisporangium ochraceum]|uniref:Histidine kinase/HSP90-like ATPase domain-containing protein n=1 Tax=Virgisporangium ochraceum TaxID=65505 RepID=A0A8J4A770_9ACTN|nr:ATP-binding protein [Virgisporangium ochraceum]GIJ75150.1 hypothetical protein Voc01_100670 [Virgisporangium ochraceum]
MSLSLILSLPRQPSTVTCSRLVLAALLSLTDATEECRHELAVIMTEACTNAVMHSTPGSAVDINVTVDDGWCVLEVGNRGHTGRREPMRLPTDALRIGGRGLPLMASFADTMAFLPTAAGHVRLQITKRLSARNADPGP